MNIHTLLKGGPELASLVPRLPAGAGWRYEYKYDGYRIVAVVTGGDARLLTRNGKDFTDAFKPLAAPLGKLPHQPFVVDGEVVAAGRGRAGFQDLQQLFKRNVHTALRYMIFDVLAFEGRDLTRLPLAERRKHIELLLRRPSGPLLRAPAVKGPAENLMKRACSEGFEGIVAKRLSAPYRSGRTRDWLKCKCGNREEFLVVGYTRHSKVPAQIGALLLGLKAANDIFILCGKVGTGFDHHERSWLYDRLRPAEADLTLLNREVLPRRAALVRPRLVAEIQFTEWTSGGLLRHPSFLGLRADKPARHVTLAASSHPARQLRV